jgi:hypothetical protein
MNRAFTILLCTVFFKLSIQAQNKYLAGNLSFTHQSTRANSGLIQSNMAGNTSLLLLPEYGIIKENGTMFGLSAGLYWRRLRTQGSSSNLIAGALGMNYRRILGDKSIQPFLETGLLAFVGQFNPPNQGEEFFQGQIPIRAGALYNFKPSWAVLGSVDIFTLNYTRTASTTDTSLGLFNGSTVKLSAIRYLR